MEHNNNAEIYVPVLGFEGYYEVSNKGNVRSLDRHFRLKTNGFGMAHRKGRVLRPALRKGYKFVHLHVFDKEKKASIHRLVATAFIPNPENKETVNHKNGIRTDNRVENLEWCTGLENIRHAHATGLIRRHKGELCKVSKRVFQYSKQGELIRIWASAREAEEVAGYQSNGIGGCCNRKESYHFHRGFIFSFTELSIEECLQRSEIKRLTQQGSGRRKAA